MRARALLLERTVSSSLIRLRISGESAMFCVDEKAASGRKRKMQSLAAGDVFVCSGRGGAISPCQRARWVPAAHPTSPGRSGGRTQSTGPDAPIGPSPEAGTGRRGGDQRGRRHAQDAFVLIQRWLYHRERQLRRRKCEEVREAQVRQWSPQKFQSFRVVASRAHRNVRDPCEYLRDAVIV